MDVTYIIDINDLINALFELSAGFFVFLSVRKTLQDKRVQSVNWLTTAFFAVWGIWNLYYYPSLDQWYSFIGGISVAFMNTWWFFLLIYYSKYPGGKYAYN